MTQQNDILDEMTREELIAWVRSQAFMLRPKRSELLFLRWELQSAAVLQAVEEEMDTFGKIDFAERDRLAARFNETQDLNEKARLIVKLKPYQTALVRHMETMARLKRRRVKVDKLYQQIAIEREKERAHGRNDSPGAV